MDDRYTELLKMYTPKERRMIADALYDSRKRKLDELKFWAERSNKRTNSAFELKFFSGELEARGELAKFDRLCQDFGWLSCLSFYNRQHRTDY